MGSAHTKVFSRFPSEPERGDLIRLILGEARAYRRTSTTRNKLRRMRREEGDSLTHTRTYKMGAPPIKLADLHLIIYRYEWIK